MRKLSVIMHYSKQKVYKNNNLPDGWVNRKINEPERCINKRKKKNRNVVEENIPNEVLLRNR